MRWFAGLQRPMLYFSSASLAAIIAALGLFLYVDASIPPGQVLGVTVSADQNSLFGPNVRLVKTADSPQVYAVVAGKKHPLRNEEVFYSYGFDFAKVAVVSRQELNKYAPVVLAKEQNSGRVYYLSHGKGLKKYHPTPQAFAAYPANAWGSVITLSSKDLSYWPQARLLKSTTDAKVYFVDGNRKAWVPTESEFRNAGFSWSEILTVFPDDLKTYQTVDYSIDLVRGEQRPSTAPDQITPAQPVGSGQLVVSISANSPSARLLPLTTTHNTASIFKMQAVWGQVQIAAITLTKRGLSSPKAIEQIIIEDENGTVYGTTNGFNNDGKAVVRFSPKVFLVPRDSEKQLIVKISVAAQAQHDTTASLGIAEADDIDANAAVSGIFPAFGAEHKFVTTQGSIGAVSLAGKIITASERDVNIGVKKAGVAEFTFRETSGSEDVALMSISFFNEGTARDDDIDYLYLYKDGRQVAATKYFVNDAVFFDFAKNPIVIKKNNDVTLALKVDIAKGDNASLKIVIAKPRDVVMQGLTQNFNISPVAAEGFPVGRGAGADVNRFVFRREGIGLFATSRSEDEREVHRAATNALLGEFELRGVSGEIFLQKLRLQWQKENQAPDLQRDLLMYDETNKREMARVDRFQLAANESITVNLEDYPVAADAVLKIQFISDIPETSVSNNIYRVVIEDLTYTIGTSNTEYAHGSVVRGQTMIVVSPSLAITSAPLPNNGATIASGESVTLAGFNLKASVEDRVKVTSVTVSLSPGSHDVTFPNGFSNLALYNGRRRVSEVVARPNSTTYTFNNINISISAGRSIILTVKADTQPIAAGTTVRFLIEDVSVTSYSSQWPVQVEGDGTASEAVTFSGE